ncbi:3-keto-5-aminohexanoate cleavage enzyme [Baekduia alba]|nr:3-keto-5-aminohexanoate cleavage enzyme [Baekduia alba]
MNGSWTRDHHPEVPVSLEQVVADAVACHAAGAASVHFHPRRADDGRETLAAATHDAVVAAVRAAAPDLEISCSTQEDIDLGGAADRAAAIRAWTSPPDVVSLNLEQDDALTLGAALLERGVGIEAGIFTLKDAERLLGAPWAGDVRRVLVEVIYAHEPDDAVALARAIDARTAELGRPRLWHGDGRASWAVVDAGIAAGRDVRVGLEDAIVARDGGRAPGNAAQVRDTVARAAAAHAG